MNRSPSLSLNSPTSAPNPSALRQWITAFCIIRFDIDQGQTVEDCFPPDALPADRLLLVAFYSFPDSTSLHLPRHRSSIHDSIFSFRLPDSTTAGYIYGYVFNRQRQDGNLPRGSEQKSVVALTPHPYSSVFRPLLQILGPLCFDLGPAALRLVASHVSAWPAPRPGPAPIDLPIGGAALRAYLPADSLFPDADLFCSFRGILLHLWTLWELMILGEPLLVLAPSPPQCSEAVASLISLIAPLLCSVDFRPYFTIHDPDFAHLNSLHGDRFPPMILGVTNLFFLKALRSIPHVVSVGTPHPSSNPARLLPVRSSPGRLNIEQLAKFSPTSLMNAIKVRREGPLSLMGEHKEALWTSYAPTTKPDTAVLNRLVDAGVSSRIEESMSIVNNEILRRHFGELTTNFLAPFGPYLRPSAPSEGTSPFANPQPLPPFRADEFLNGLAARGPGKFLSKRMRSNWLELYRRFLQGQNFMPWFQKRRAAAELEQRRLWRQARLSVDIRKLISRMNELEIVDAFNAIERHLADEMQLQQSGNARADSATACEKLKGDQEAVFNVLPKDMQQLMLCNPKWASLFQASREPT